MRPSCVAGTVRYQDCSACGPESTWVTALNLAIFNGTQKPSTLCERRARLGAATGVQTDIADQYAESSVGARGAR